MRIAIIGGGITGLTAAYVLTSQGHSVSVFEKEAYLGGLAYGFKGTKWNWSLEGAYHHFFTNDTAIITLAKNIGLTDDLIYTRPVTATFVDNSSSQLDSPINLLTFPQLPIIDRIRTGMLLAYCKLTPNWKPLESVTAETWLKQWGGSQGWNILWQPLLYGKFNEYAPRVAASWFWARIKKRTPTLGYFRGGFQTFIDKLEKQIIKHHGIMYTSFPIERIVRSDKTGTFFVKKQQMNGNDEKFEFEQVLITTPTPIAAKLVNFPKSFLETPLRIPHLWAQTLILETDRPIMDKIYWLNVNDRTFPFLAAVAHTNFMDKKEYNNHHLTYFGNYLPQGHPYLSIDKKQLLKEFLPFIKRINPNIESRFTIRDTYMFTAPFAQPVHEVKYSLRAPKMVTPVPGLYLANMDSIYPWDRGTNYAVELGQKAAQLFEKFHRT